MNKCKFINNLQSKNGIKSINSLSDASPSYLGIIIQLSLWNKTASSV